MDYLPIILDPEKGSHRVRLFFGSAFFCWHFETRLTRPAWDAFQLLQSLSEAHGLVFFLPFGFLPLDSSGSPLNRDFPSESKSAPFASGFPSFLILLPANQGSRRKRRANGAWRFVPSSLFAHFWEKPR